MQGNGEAVYILFGIVIFFMGYGMGWASRDRRDRNRRP